METEQAKNEGKRLIMWAKWVFAALFAGIIGAIGTSIGGSIIDAWHTETTRSKSNQSELDSLRPFVGYLYAMKEYDDSVKEDNGEQPVHVVADTEAIKHPSVLKDSTH